MSHKTRVERHIIVDLIAGVAAASLVVVVINKSLAAVLLTLAAGIALFLLERNNIKEEDQLETDHDYVPPAIAYKPMLSSKDLIILWKKSEHPPSENISESDLAPYIAGLEDGAAEMAKWTLGQIQDSNEN